MSQVCKREGGCGNAPAMWIDGGIQKNLKNKKIIKKVGSTPMSGLDRLSPHSWPGDPVFSSFQTSCVCFFNSSELVENDEAHSDLTEELDW